MLLFLIKTLLTAPTVSSFMQCLQRVCGDQIISRGLWVPCLLVLTCATFTCEGMLKGKVHSCYPYTEGESSIQNVVLSVSPSKLWHARVTCLCSWRKPSATHSLNMMHKNININFNTLYLITMDPYWQQIGIMVIVVLGAYTWNDWSVKWCMMSFLNSVPVCS